MLFKEIQNEYLKTLNIRFLRQHPVSPCLGWVVGHYHLHNGLMGFRNNQFSSLDCFNIA